MQHPQNSVISQETSVDELLKIEQEAEILREQVETLKQELKCELQLVQEYHQELLYANSEISLLNCELQDTFRLQKLKLAQAKRLAQNILITRRFTSKSLAELLSFIYDDVVTANELKPISNQCDEAFEPQSKNAA